MKMKITASKTASQNFNNIDEWIEKVEQLANELHYNLEQHTQHRYYLSPKTSISTEELDITIYLSEEEDLLVPSCIVEMSHLNSDDYSSDISIETILGNWSKIGKLITFILKSRISV